MEVNSSWLSEFASWAWARHHNVLSWWIRPFFLIPYCYFSYKRNWMGIILTLILLATSMFWFPAPNMSELDPQVREFLEMERQYLLGPMTAEKIAWTLLVPLSFFLLAYAFWKRSLWAGVAIVNLMSISKMIWSVNYGGESAVSLLLVAIPTLLLINLIFYGLWRATRRSSRG